MPSAAFHSSAGRYIPRALPYEEVELHLVPNEGHGIMDIRVWFKNQMLQSITLPLEGIRVHFRTSKVSTFQLFPTFPCRRTIAVGGEWP
jgi:hypothetical protein